MVYTKHNDFVFAERVVEGDRMAAIILFTLSLMTFTPKASSKLTH